MKAWLLLLRPGDWLVACLGLAAVAASFPLLWHGGPAERAVVKRGGEVFAELSLQVARRLDVPGPLGTTVIEVQPGRARVRRRSRTASVLREAGLAGAEHDVFLVEW